MSTFSLKNFTATTATVAGLGLTLTACSGAEFDATVPHAYVWCYETSPAVEAAEMSFYVNESFDAIVIHAESAAGNSHVVTGSHRSYMSQCLPDDIITADPITEYPPVYRSDGGVIYQEEHVIINWGRANATPDHKILMSYSELVQPDGLVEYEIKFEPLPYDATLDA